MATYSTNNAYGMTDAEYQRLLSQKQGSQTYSPTPYATPPQPYTANQGTQDVVRNTYLAQATQGTQVNRNDPNFRQQVEPFVAAQERGRKQYLNEAAERLSAQGMGSSGALQQEARFASERASQASGAFESQLVGRELENRRQEIREALAGLSGIITNDQARALQRELTDLDAAIKRELGTGALNIDLLRALLQNQQFGKELGTRIGEIEARYAPWMF